MPKPALLSLGLQEHTPREPACVREITSRTTQRSATSEKKIVRPNTYDKEKLMETQISM
jgi:hypothetical protein